MPLRTRRSRACRRVKFQIAVPVVSVPVVAWLSRSETICFRMTNNVKSVPFSVKTLSFQCVVDDDDDESYNKEPVEMHKMKRRNLTVLSSETNDSHGNVRISSPITTIPHMPKKPLSVEPTIEQRRFDGTSVCFYGRRTTRTIRDRSTRTKRRNGPGVTCRRPDGANAAGRT